jgi:dimeric dUTPase (all-alpha-NTP-PPase superfamily)
MSHREDMLQKIFDLQKELVDFLVADRYPRKQDERISVLMTALMHEAIELQSLTSWKWWKRPSEFEIEKAQKELVDILHFVIQTAIELNMTPEKLLQEYMNKNYINRKRKQQGY